MSTPSETSVSVALAGHATALHVRPAAKRVTAAAATLAVLYVVAGRLSFLAEVENAIVTPVFFAAEGVSLAVAILFGPWIWPGVFVGQLVLALGRDLPVTPSVLIASGNSLEAILAAVLFRRLRLNHDVYDLRTWAWLQTMIFVILQPLSAAIGTTALRLAGTIDTGSDQLASGINWWIGNSIAQSQLTPLLLLLFDSRSRKHLVRRLLPPLVVVPTILAVVLVTLDDHGIGLSVVLFLPVLVFFALRMGLKAVCLGSVLMTVSYLVITELRLGPFFRDGQVNYVDLNVFVMAVSLVAQFIAVLFHQITLKQRLLETKLKTSLVASAVAHEINLPLSNVLLAARLASRMIEEPNSPVEQVQPVLKNLAGEATRIVETIEKMRVLLRNVQTRPQQTDLSSVVQSAILTVDMPLRSHGIRIESGGFSSPCSVDGDAAQLKIAVVNLITNAIEAIASRPDGQREIEVTLKRSDRKAIITVGDSGPGIDEKLLAEAPLTTTKADGSGIGLFVVRTAVENHNGNLEFGRSRLGGAEVRILLPLADQVTAADDSPRVSPARTRGSAPPLESPGEPATRSPGLGG